ncbi:M81 family metallopeptidase [Bradyrhizobium sp. CCGE-LA001]|uniref:M81 family metallopeptidase n=1 Tax=Bradyrhizobium sp. CCGE-LA001 TaxID=1223566 RepID=UPI003FA49DFE
MRAIKGDVKPRIGWDRRPVLTPTLKQRQSVQPMKDLMDEVIAAVRSGRVLNASISGLPKGGHHARRPLRCHCR